jgi:hypothetical protein
MVVVESGGDIRAQSLRVLRERVAHDHHLEEELVEQVYMECINDTPSHIRLDSETSGNVIDRDPGDLVLHDIICPG